MEVKEKNIPAQRSSADNAVKTLAALVSPVSSPTTSGIATLPLEVKAELKRQQLHLAVDGYHPIASISFRKPQSKDFSAKPLNQRDKCLCLRVSTQSKHGRRHVSIYSPLKIKNQLSQPIQVSYQELTHDVQLNRHGSTRHILGKVEPDGTMNIPSAVALQKKLQVKPVAEDSVGSASDYGDSTEPLWWKDHLKIKKETSRSSVARKLSPSSTQLLTCSNLLMQSFTFKAVWVSHSCQADDCTGICPSFYVSIEPVIRVSNFLPFLATLNIHANVSVGHSPSSYTLEPGQNVQVVESINVPTKCTFVIPSYQGSAWQASFDLHDRMPEGRMAPLLLSSFDSERPGSEGHTGRHSLTILTNVSRSVGYKGSQGQLRITFFSAYWISNSTGLTLQFKSSGIGSNTFESSDPSPILFMASALQNKLKLRIPGSNWSKSFAVDAAGTAGSVSSQSRDGRHKHRFMVETTLSNTQLTKIINIFPLFVVLNKTQEAIMFKETTPKGAPRLAREVGEAPQANASEDEAEPIVPMISVKNSWTEILPEQVLPFWPTSLKKPQSMVVKRVGSEVFSSPFPVSIPQRTLLPIDNQAAITADVSGGLGTEFFITLRPYHLGDCVVRLENLTQHSLCFTQGSQSGTEPEASCSLTIDSCKSWLYFWPNPRGERQLYWYAPQLKIKPQLAKFTEDCCGEIKYEEKSIHWQSYGDTLQRVLTFSESVQFQTIIHKKSQREQADMFMFIALEYAFLSFINKNSLEIAVLSINQSPSNWFVKIDGQEKWFPLGLKLSAAVEAAYCDPCKDKLEVTYQRKEIKIDLSELRFVEPLHGDLRRDSFPGLKFQYQRSELSMVIQASINHMQLDNQLPDAFYPVAFHPLAPRKSSRRPCIQVFIKKHFPLAAGADAYKRVDVDLQHCALRIDKGFTLSFLDFITDCRKSGDDHPDTLMKSYHELDIDYAMRNLAEDTMEKMNKLSGAKVYMEYLRFSNIQIKLSFSMGGNAHLTDVGNTQSTFGGDVVDFLFRSIGMTLTEVTDIDFSLSEFTVTCTVVTTGQMSSDLITFYKSQAISQGYVFVLGLDIIGNPLGLAKDVRKGLKDFFASADPLNFNNESHKSLAQGIRSAYGSIVGGVCGTGSKITESVGRGLNLLTFDRSFQKARGRRVKSQPSHLAESLLLSGKTFGYAFGSGVTGVVTQPKKGAQRQGATGFFKGVGKGVIGILIKPAGGVFDSISVLLGGLRRATQSDMNEVERVRLPRHTIPFEGVTKYHPYLSKGVSILHTTTNYTYFSDDVYWSHMMLTIERKKFVILATTKRLELLHLPWYSTFYRPVWSVLVEDLCKPEHSPGVITLVMNGQGERKTLESDDHETLEWFFRRLKSLRSYSKATYKTSPEQ
ncbi:intermembrane lipid transfer protein VPS13C-like isoform X2 [Watersipora subatra]|uniref:intermembrane lipid transfer protein VPS13C-like isoform X2 n=1 Tax=Watersipora subatra TaxID=2589382 RepID=UPI00355B4F21